MFATRSASRICPGMSWQHLLHPLWLEMCITLSVGPVRYVIFIFNAINLINLSCVLPGSLNLFGVVALSVTRSNQPHAAGIAVYFFCFLLLLLWPYKVKHLFYGALRAARTAPVLLRTDCRLPRWTVSGNCLFCCVRRCRTGPAQQGQLLSQLYHGAMEKLKLFVLIRLTWISNTVACSSCCVCRWSVYAFKSDQGSTKVQGGLDRCVSSEWIVDKKI